MNPKGRMARSRQYRGDVEDQGDEHPENGPGGGLRPRAYGLVGPAVSPPDVLRGRGRIFPTPARGNPAPELGSFEACPLRARSDSHPRYLTATQRQVAIPADLGSASPARTG